LKATNLDTIRHPINAVTDAGVAIPHARMPGLSRPCGLLARLKPPIEFDAFDGQKVDIVFVLLLPATAENEAVGALASVARSLRSPEILARLGATRNTAEMFAAMR